MTPDRLNAHLLEIENGLGGSGELPPYWLEDKLHWHLCKIEELINGGGGGGSISFVIVDKLPETGEKNIVYLVPKKTIFSRNKYDEYVWVNDDFEYIGTGAFDPTGYATIEYVDTELLKKQDKLSFNIEEVPVTAQTLTSIKDGENVYVIPSSGQTVEWSDIANKPDFKEVSFTADYNDLINTPTIPADTSDLTNGAGFITESALSGYATEEWVSNQDYITESALSGYATEQWVSDQGYSTFSGSYDDLTEKPTLFSGAYDDLTGKPDLSIYAESADLSTVATTGDYDDLENKPELFSGSYNDLTDKPDLFSGDYEDLINKPTIPTDTSDLTNGAGFITGITSTDVTTALGYTPYNSSNPSGYITSSALSGYATEIWVGEQGYLTSVAWDNIDDKPTFVTVATSGSYNDLIDKPDLFDGDYDSLTNKPDLTVYEEKTNLKECAYLDEDGLEINYNQLTNTPSIPENTSDLTNDSGFITADYHDSTKQDTLVSGTNIKTVDGNSLLGSGNINTKEKYTVNLLVDMDTGKVTMSQEDIDYLYSVKPSDCYVVSPNPTLGSVKQIYELVGYVEVGSEKQLVYKTLDTFDSDYLGNTLVAIPKSSSDAITPVEQELAKYSDIPTKTSDLTNDGDGVTQNDPYAKISDITTPTFTATTFNPDSAITFSQEDLADMYENQYDIIKVVAEILPNVFFNLSFRKTADTEASGLTSVKYDYTTCTNNDTLEEIGFQVFKNNNTYSTTPYHLQLQNSPVTDVQTSDGTSIVSNKIATLPAVYAHHIYLKGASDDKTNLYCTLITNFSTAFDLDSFFAYVYNLGATGAISATGTVVYSVVGTTENCRAAAAIKAGSTAEKLILVYHGTGDAGISTIEVGKAGANVDLNTIADSVIKVI